MKRLPYKVTPSPYEGVVTFSVIVHGDTYALCAGNGVTKAFVLEALALDVSHALGEPVELYEETK